MRIGLMHLFIIDILVYYIPEYRIVTKKKTKTDVFRKQYILLKTPVILISNEILTAMVSFIAGDEEKCR